MFIHRPTPATASPSPKPSHHPTLYDLRRGVVLLAPMLSLRRVSGNNHPLLKAAARILNTLAPQAALVKGGQVNRSPLVQEVGAHACLVFPSWAGPARNAD